MCKKSLCRFNLKLSELITRNSAIKNFALQNSFTTSTDPKTIFFGDHFSFYCKNIEEIYFCLFESLKPIKILSLRFKEIKC